MGQQKKQNFRGFRKSCSGGTKQGRKVCLTGGCSMPQSRPVCSILQSTCHSEPRSGEESREQDTEATEYGILHSVQDDRILFGRRTVLESAGSQKAAGANPALRGYRNTVSPGRGFRPGRYIRRGPCRRPAAPYRRNWFLNLTGYIRGAASAPRKRCR